MISSNLEICHFSIQLESAKMNEDIFLKVDNYISNLPGIENKALTDTIKSLEDENIPQISVSANHGKFLQELMISCR